MGTIGSSIQELSNAFSTLSPIILNMVIALVILLLGFIIGKVLSNLVKRLLRHVKLDDSLIKVIRIDLNLESFAAAVVSFVIYFLTVIAALNQVGLLGWVIKVITYAVVMVILVMILLGLKDFIPNMVAGFYVKGTMHLRVGRKVHIDSVQGTILSVNLVAIAVETAQKDRVLVPFSLLLKNKVLLSG
ncbi:hypothetical protein C4573_05090 [Candidatus Woesearchaeota archaeon]|nr:MAG: hypothetical protein C4573_05090 [Candidatus Woesearchaeota archaeon]